MFQRDRKKGRTSALGDCQLIGASTTDTNHFCYPTTGKNKNGTGELIQLLVLACQLVAANFLFGGMGPTQKLLGGSSNNICPEVILFVNVNMMLSWYFSSNSFELLTFSTDIVAYLVI